MNIISIGILFNSFVTAIVSLTALALTLFLWQRRHELDESMQAYTWFWFSTMLVWGNTSLRYFWVSQGIVGGYIHVFDVVVQAGVFASGPTLFYYLGLRVLNNRRLSIISAWISVGLGALAIWLAALPNGNPVRDISYFSADSTVNPASFMIFSAQAAIIFVLLVYDIARRWHDWRRHGIQKQLYQAAYSFGVVIYLGLGSIDESKMLTDWPLVVFRMLYAGGFLLVYLVITLDEKSREQNLIRSSDLPISYGNAPSA